MNKALKNFWNYYIKGHYHCDTCPFCWGGEYLVGCDDYDDAGCYIKGDIADCSCRLIPPIRFLIGWGRRKKTTYLQNHEYDDIDVWYMEKERKQEIFAKFLKKIH